MDDLISRQAVQNYIAHFLSLYLQDNVREAVEAIDEVIGDMPSVDIPQDHDGCKDCRYQDKGEDELPCCECQQNYKDKWEAKANKTGHWIEEDMFDGDVAYRCSECDELFWLEDGTPKDNGYDFCPKCGKRLVESQGRSDKE